MKSKILKTLSFLLALTMLLSLLAGCGSNQDANSSPDGSGDPTITTAPPSGVTAQLSARLLSEDDNAPWYTTLTVSNGQTIELKLAYTNVSDANHYNVAMRLGLPAELEYVPGSTKLCNAEYPYPEGCAGNNDNIITDGVHIGNYAPCTNPSTDNSAYVIVRAFVTCTDTETVNVTVTGDIIAGPEGVTVAPVAAGMFITIGNDATATGDPETGADPSVTESADITDFG